MTVTATAAHSMVYTETPMQVFGQYQYLVSEYGIEWPPGSPHPTFNVKFTGLTQWQLSDVLTVANIWWGRPHTMTVTYEHSRPVFSMHLVHLSAEQFDLIVKVVRSWSNVDETHRENRGK